MKGETLLIMASGKLGQMLFVSGSKCLKKKKSQHSNLNEKGASEIVMVTMVQDSSSQSAVMLATLIILDCQHRRVIYT